MRCWPAKGAGGATGTHATSVSRPQPPEGLTARFLRNARLQSPPNPHSPRRGLADTRSSHSSPALCPMSLWSPNGAGQHQAVGFDFSLGAPEKGGRRAVERERTGLREGARGHPIQRIGLCLEEEETRALGWALTQESESGGAYLRPGQPLALCGSSAARRSAFIACQSLPRLLKRRGLLCARGRRRRGERKGGGSGCRGKSRRK